jgi:hypothetical protein
MAAMKQADIRRVIQTWDICYLSSIRDPWGMLGYDLFTFTFI